jgi:hypothetical protein
MIRIVSQDKDGKYFSSTQTSIGAGIASMATLVARPEWPRGNVTTLDVMVRLFEVSQLRLLRCPLLLVQERFSDEQSFGPMRWT